MDTLKTLLLNRCRYEREAHGADPFSSTGSLARVRLEDIDAELGRMAPHIDVAFRSHVLGKPDFTAVGRGGRDFPLQIRALGATARSSLQDKTFVETFMGAAVQTAPLLDLSTVVNTSHTADVYFSTVVTHTSSNGIVTDGSSISESDPAFGGSTILRAFAYKNFLTLSAELVADGAFNAEGYAGERIGALAARKFSDDAWGGAGGSSAPEGLLAALTTVNAAGAAIVTFDDIAALLNGVPAASRYGGNCTILLSPGAHIDLIEEQPLHDWASGTIHGFPFRVDPALADPATTTKSCVAGDFKAGYAVRLAPLRVEVSPEDALSTDQVRVRIVLRADGRKLDTAQLRALVHP